MSVMYVSDYCHVYNVCSIAGVDQIIYENEQLLTEKYVLQVWPSAFIMYTSVADSLVRIICHTCITDSSKFSWHDTFVITSRS